MKQLVAFLLALSIALVPNLLAAQERAPVPPPPPTTPATADAPTSPVNGMTASEVEMIRAAVQRTGGAYRASRKADGIGGVIGSVIVLALGGYFYSVGKQQNDPGIQVIGVGIGISAVPQLVAGIWNIFYPTPQEEIAEKIAADDALVAGAGLTFVEQEALRGKRTRLVGGTTQILQGGATLATYYLYTQVFPSTNANDILLIFFSVAAGLQVLGGIITLVGKSGSERSYDRLLNDLGRSPETASKSKTGKFQWFPTLVSDEGRVAPGLGVGARF